MRAKRGNRISRWLASGSVALALTGCTSFHDYVKHNFKVGPEYQKPPAPVSEGWIDSGDVRVRSVSTDELRHWWTAFNDPALTALVCNAYQQNLTLREAGCRILQARADLGIAVGEIFPQTQQALGSYEAIALSKEVANRQFIAQRFYSQWNVGLGLAWELDFWGKFRRAIEAAEDDLDASIENYDDVLVLLIGEVADTYVLMRTLEQRIVLAKTNVELQRLTLGIATARFKGGQATELDVDQAQSDLSATESLIPQLEVQRRQANNRLCVLLGLPTTDLRPQIGEAPIPKVSPDVALGIPAELLTRRPDIRRAERQAAAGCARIGIATAELYPHIAVQGQIGYTAMNFPHLFSPGAMSGNVAPGFQWNILNYGRLLNNIRDQDARFQALVVNYHNVVLQANEEVENGLVKFLQSQERVKFLEESTAAALKGVQVAIAQYKAGTVDFNRVAVLQEKLVERQEGLAEAQGEIARGLVEVYKALGGGWQIRIDGCDPALPPPATLEKKEPIRPEDGKKAPPPAVPAAK